MAGERLIEYKGEVHSMSEWAKLKGMSCKTLSSRINQFGWSFEKAIETPICRNHDVKYIEYKGEVHNIAEWAEIKDMNIQTIHSRLKRGWSFEDAIETPVYVGHNNPNAILIEYKGEVHTLNEWAKIKKINKETIRHRLRRGWSFEDAIETPIGTNYDGNYIEYNGEKHSITEWAEIVNITPNCLYKRLKAKWPIEEALGFKERASKRKTSTVKIIEYNGESHNMLQWSHIRNIPWSTLYYRIYKLNWPIEEALGFKEHINKKVIKGDHEMLESDTKVTLHEDRSCTIPTVWTDDEDNIIKEGIRNSIDTYKLYQMLGGKHSADSIELRKAVLMKSMGMVYNTAVDEKQEYTMRDIVAFIYPNIDGTYTQNKEYKRAVGRIRPLLRSLKLDRNVITKNTSEKHYKLTTAELNKVRNKIYKKYPEGIKSKIIYNNTSNSEEVVVCTIKNPNTGNVEPAITYNPNTNTETYHVTKDDMYADKEETQQLFNVQQQYKNQIKQLNEFLIKLQQDNNTEIKGLKIHMSDNSVKLFVTWN